MARWCEPTDEQVAGWAAWVASRPACVRVVAERFEPWSLYRMTNVGGQRVTIASFGEDADGLVTLTVTVSAEFNLVLFERQVFGVDPDNLEPCELPTPQDIRGAILSQDEVEEHIDALRVMARPDLWEMDEDGIAQKKRTH
jgi:hypothetical protein